MSGRWGCRPLGAWGLMEVKPFEVPFSAAALPGTAQGPEYKKIVRSGRASVDSPLGSIGASTTVLAARFASFSLYQ